MQLDRRQFLIASLAGSALAARQAPAQPSPLLDKGFGRVTRIAEGVYATIADPSKGQQCLSNGGVVAGRDAVLIVEGHFQPEGAMLEIEAARMVSKAPVMAAIDTHYHLDHSFGNLGYATARIPIIAHEGVTPLMRDRYEALKGKDKAPLLTPLEQKLAKAASAAETQRAQTDLDAARWWCGAVDSATLAFPTDPLLPKDLPKRIDLGGLTVAIEFHLGHTPTDLIIRIPERDVVFTGDLLFYRQYPVCVDADMLAWRKVLDRFAAYNPRTRFVPGHGAVCGLETIRDQVALFDDLREHADNMMRAGASAEEAERRYTVPARFKEYGIFSWNWTIAAALRSYYAGLRAAARGQSRPERWPAITRTTPNRHPAVPAR